MKLTITKTKRNPYLDYLRGISALLVLLFHYTSRYDMLYGHVENYPFMMSRGSFAVLMFFLLSGYLTFKGLNRYEPKSFVKNRFFRLYPTYWLCLIPTMVLVSIFLPDQVVSIKDFALNFTMLQLYLGVKFVDGAYWTLSCEVLFYVLIVLLLAFKGKRYGTHLLLGWFVLQVILLLLPDSGFYMLAKKFNRFLYFHCFMAGGVVAILEEWLKEMNSKRTRSSWLASILLILALVFFIAQQFIDHEFDSGVFMAVSVVLLGGSIVLYEKVGGVFSCLHKLLAPLAWIATISYPLYLLHQNIGYIIIQQMERHGMTNELFLLIPITIIMIAAWLIHKYIEQPCSRIGIKKQ